MLFGLVSGLEVRTSLKPPQRPLELQSHTGTPWALENSQALKTSFSSSLQLGEIQYRISKFITRENCALVRSESFKCESELDSI